MGHVSLLWNGFLGSIKILQDSVFVDQALHPHHMPSNSGADWGLRMGQHLYLNIYSFRSKWITAPSSIVNFPSSCWLISWKSGAILRTQCWSPLSNGLNRGRNKRDTVASKASIGAHWVPIKWGKWVWPNEYPPLHHWPVIISRLLPKKGVTLGKVAFFSCEEAILGETFIWELSTNSHSR